jgi:hypothetical protein
LQIKWKATGHDPDMVRALALAIFAAGCGSTSPPDAPASPLTLNPGAIDLGLVEAGPHLTTATLMNPTSVDVAIDSIAVSGVGYTQSSTCGGTLAAGASCDITIQFDATQIGMASGILAIVAADATLSAPITASVGGRLTIQKAGEADGTVTSNIGGIDCGTVCTALLATPVTLTATPGANVDFIGWSVPSCGAATTCVLPGDIVARMVTATFAGHTANAVHIQFAGDAQGSINVIRNSQSYVCNASCTVPALPGDMFDVLASTPSVLGGFTGGCTATGGECFFTFTSNTTVTVTFSKSPGEQWTRLLLPQGNVRNAAYDSTNQLVLGTTAGVVALDTMGVTRWSVATVPKPGNASMTVPASGRVALDPADNVFVVANHSTLAKLSPTGGFVWSVDLGGDADTDSYNMARPFGASPNGDVAVQVGDVLKVYSSTGQLRWTSGAISNVANAVAIDSAGNIATLHETANAENLTAARFDATGNPLSEPDHVTQQYRGCLAFDSQNNYVTSSSGFSHAYVEKWTADGTTSIFMSSAAIGGGNVDNGVAVGSADDIYSVRRQSSSEQYGYVAQRHSATGTLTWNLTRAEITTSLGTDGVTPYGIAADRLGNVAIVGQYLGDFMQGPLVFVQVFKP